MGIAGDSAISLISPCCTRAFRHQVTRVEALRTCDACDDFSSRISAGLGACSPDERPLFFCAGGESPMIDPSLKYGVLFTGLLLFVAACGDDGDDGSGDGSSNGGS